MKIFETTQLKNSQVMNANIAMLECEAEVISQQTLGSIINNEERTRRMSCPFGISANIKYFYHLIHLCSIKGSF